MGTEAAANMFTYNESDELWCTTCCSKAPNHMILVFSFPKVLLNMEIIKRDTVH